MPGMSSPGLGSAALNLRLQLVMFTVCQAVLGPLFRCTRQIISAKIINEDKQETVRGLSSPGLGSTAITTFNAHCFPSGLSGPHFVVLDEKYLQQQSTKTRRNIRKTVNAYVGRIG